MSVERTVDLLSLGGGLPINCRICGGQLIPAKSAAAFGGGVPDGAKRAFYSRAAKRFFICTPSGIYVSAGGTNFAELYAASAGNAFFVENIEDGKNFAAVICGAYCIIHTGESFTSRTLDNVLTCGIMHCGRLFGANGLTVYWSDAENFSKTGGSLTLDAERGEVLDICRLGEKLVFVRKFGLTCADMFGTPENFSVNITDTDTDEIIKNTACAVGGKLFFYTVSGLRAFDGSAVKSVSHRCADEAEEPVQAVAFAGAYYLVCRCKSLNAGALLCYMPDDGESCFIDAEADCICAAETVYVFSGSDAYRLEAGGKFTFAVDGINFGSGERKTVVKAFLDCGGADFALAGESGARKFLNCRGKVRPRMRGNEFSVAVSGDSPIRKITLTAVQNDAI